MDDIAEVYPLFVITANSVGSPDGSLRRLTLVVMKELEVCSLSEVVVLKEPMIGLFEVVIFALLAEIDFKDTMGGDRRT
jgi:hypothetical protein